MKLFSCSACQHLAFFENVTCVACDHELAYLPDRNTIAALERADGGQLVAVGTDARYRLCTNRVEHGACNWAIPAASADTLCLACSFTEVIPPLSAPDSVARWVHLETAKRRLFYTLLSLGLPLERRADVKGGLAFAFKQDTDTEKVMTGHADGLITVNVAEADAPFREQQRVHMHETYRTVLGHLRHEVGHYYWSRLVEHTPLHEKFRALFGDEQASYQESLDRHYKEGPAPDWGQHYVSAYASMHPWEDWAETCAHYLHMVDTLETARSYGLALRPAPVGGAEVAPVVARRLDFDDFDDLITAWFPLTLALNSMNRSMGLPDLYPFVLNTEAIEKLRFVHSVLDSASRA